jgi:serine/threonine-protein kinase
MKQRIGDRYEFDRTTDIIGRGGMGTVYKGVDTVTGQFVAVKQLKPDVLEDNPDFVERFSREAEALRRLNHPNIVSALGTIADDDAHYLIMEYVSGGSLWEEMQNTHPMTIVRVLQIALDLADALTRAHRLKILHRDLKPANILIAEDGTPRLTDFGVAQIQGKTRVTRTGAMIGTLAYLSPEALNGEPIDERSDIWAFGVILYEMLTGRNPFPDDNPTLLLTAILTKPVLDVAVLRPDVPSQLANLVGNMLIKEPEDRIDSIRKVGSEIEDMIRRLDSKTDIPISIKREIIIERHSRFDTPISSASMPIPKPVTASTVNKTGLNVVKSETGEEFILVSKNTANRMWVILALAVVIIGAIGIFIVTRPQDTTTPTTLTINSPNDNANLPPTPINNVANNPNNQNNNNNSPLPAPPVIADNEYPFLIMPSTSPNNPETALQVQLLTELGEVFRVNLSYANLVPVAVSPELELGNLRGAPPSPEQMGQLGNNARGILVLRPQRQGDQIKVFIQLGNLSRLTHLTLDRPSLERLVNLEIVVNTPQELAPYLVSAMAMVHSANGDLFEFMRMITILSDLPPATGQIMSQGVSRQIYGYFTNFVTDDAAATQFIAEAVRQDGGNPLVFMYQALLQVRDGNFESANSNLLTAQRLGPTNWAFPLYIEYIMQQREGSHELLDTILTTRTDDWFLYLLIAHSSYITNDVATANASLEQALALQPDSNFAHLLAAIIAIREGKITYATSLLGDMVRMFPNPTIGYRAMLYTFGDSMPEGNLLYTAFGSLLIGQYERVIELTDTMSQTATFPIADLYLMRGLSFCAMNRIDEAIEAYGLGLEVDPTNHLIHLLRGEIYRAQGDTEKATADREQALGLSMELDAYITITGNTDIQNISETCAGFFDIVTTMGG